MTWGGLFVANQATTTRLLFLWLLCTPFLLGAQAKDSGAKVSLDQPFQSSFVHLEHSPCVTLYTRNGRIGCGTVEREAQAAPLVYFPFTSQSNSKPTSAFTAVVEEFQLTAETIQTLLKYNSENENLLQGILVLNSTDSETTDDYISPASMYPLGYGTPSEALGYGNVQYPWNSNGDGLIEQDLFGVPMAYVHSWEASNSLREAAKKDDTNMNSNVMAKFNYYMGPDGITSADCLAWRDVSNDEWNPKCLPLGGVSVWAHAGSPPVTTSSSSNQNAQQNDQQENEGARRRLEDNNDNDNARPAIVVGGSMDATSLFHELAPGANTAASNTLAIMMAAYLIGENVNDIVLDQLPSRIVFGFFQGEAYGYLGSRTFFRDVLGGFTCYDDLDDPVYSVSKDSKSDKACLNPLTPSLTFQGLGQIAGMLAVDQVGVPLSDGVLYVHNDGSGGMGTFLANVLKAQGTEYYNVADSDATNNGNNNNGEDGFPMPPTPLQSLQSLTNGGIGGAVLTGYDYVFAKRPPYQSQLNSVLNKEMNYKSIAASATLLARTALAAAYDDGDFDYQEAATYAYQTIPELAYDNAFLLELGNCLFVDGNCKLLYKYANMEALNERDRTGLGIGTGESLGTPPNYYTGIYSLYSGQPFVQVGSKLYGAYSGNNYGNKQSDAIGVQPRMLEQALKNMLNEFLGRGSAEDENGNRLQKKSCKSRKDCANVQYCNAAGDSATCSGQGECVCSRSYFHIAKDEAIDAAVNNATGFFVSNPNDAGISPLYTEPFWDANVGVKVYRDTDATPGYVTLGAGFVSLIVCFLGTAVVKVSMKKSKVY